MLKFIHCADLHLGSALNANFPPEKSAERRRELRAAFGRIADYAAQGGYRAVLLCGDAFDADRPLRRDKEYFYNVVKSHPDVDFLYLRGNHDGAQSYAEELPNLRTFSSGWSYFNYGEVTVAGIELCGENSLSYWSSLSLDVSRTNIVMLHGQISESDGPGKINLARLRGRGIDYLALGHVHSFKSGRLDDRGVYVYSGCPEGRGFDEPGAKGIVTMQVGRQVYSAFVPFARRTVREVTCDISACADWSAALRAVRAAVPGSSGDMCRVILAGEVDFDVSGLAKQVESELSSAFYCVSVRDVTRPAVSAAALAADRTLKGAFARAVAAAEGYSEEQRARILRAGLAALAGRGDEL